MKRLTLSFLFVGAALTAIFAAIFSCSHPNVSFPITVRGKGRKPKAAQKTGTYVACLDCGKEIPYDWNQMRMMNGFRDRIDPHFVS